MVLVEGHSLPRDLAGREQENKSTDLFLLIISTQVRFPGKSNVEKDLEGQTKDDLLKNKTMRRMRTE